MNTNQGFAPIAIIIVILSVLAIGGGVYYAGKNTENTTEDTFLNTGTEDDSKKIDNSLEVSTGPFLDEASYVPPSSTENITFSTYTDTVNGITFKYPSTWSKGEVSNITNLSGTTTSVEVNFTDTTSDTTLLVTYHLAPAGLVLYNSLLSDFNSSKGWYVTGGKKIQVAGKTAIEANMIYTVNGKGEPISPLQNTIVDFLDKNQTGEIELQLQTPVSNKDTQALVFNQILSSFQFTK